MQLSVALLGGAGALAGRVTAKKDSTISKENDKVIHDYTVLVNIDSLSIPIVRLQAQWNFANEIIGLVNVIINRNNKGSNSCLLSCFLIMMLNALL